MLALEPYPATSSEATQAPQFNVGLGSSSETKSDSSDDSNAPMPAPGLRRGADAAWRTLRTTATEIGSVKATYAQTAAVVEVRAARPSVSPRNMLRIAPPLPAWQHVKLFSQYATMPFWRQRLLGDLHRLEYPRRTRASGLLSGQPVVRDQVAPTLR